MTGQLLEEQISKGRREISAESMSMSISEISSLYREGTLVIRPEFQRLFRWTRSQKSKLVESILLGIPIPSIFVSQSPRGPWELVDGLQRVSTLLEFQGLLEGEDGSPQDSLLLEGTEYLPALEAKTWDGRDSTVALSDAQKLDVRLARLDVKVLKRDSDQSAKYDLFQRLNSYGTVLTSQEIRSAQLSSVNGHFLSWLISLSKRDSFVDSTSLGGRLLEEQYDLELLLRFLMLHDKKLSGGALRDFPSKLNKWAVNVANSWPSDKGRLEKAFYGTFEPLYELGGADIFRRWDSSRQDFRGGFLNSAYEIIAIGAGWHVAHGEPFRRDVLTAVKEVWEGDVLKKGFATGVATGDRFANLIPHGRKLMAEH